MNLFLTILIVFLITPSFMKPKTYVISNHINSYICDDYCKNYIKNNPEQPITILKKE